MSDATPTTDRSFDVSVDGGTLRVWEWGPAGGDPLVALHGITAHGRSFRSLAERLPDHRILAPDLRGRGASRDIAGHFSMAAHADDVAAVLDVAGVESATVLGHSMGGFAALVAAHRHPMRVDRLVLVDGGLPLALPEAVLALAPDELIGAVIGPALTRLRMTFASRAEYRAMWRRHPALADDWGPIIEAYVDEDLVGEAPELRPGATEESVLADGTSELLHDDVERAIDALVTPIDLVAASYGLLAADAPPLYADDQIYDFADAHVGVMVHRIPDVNHYTILLSERGADAVAAVVGHPTQQNISVSTA